MSGLPPFPAWQGPAPETPALLRERGFFLRPACDADLPGLRGLYADSRADEMAGVPWPAMAKQSFLDGQFDLQHRHYLQHYAGADFLVIERLGEVQGRYYLRRTAPDHLVVDICLLAAHRSQGLGRALIQASQAQAQALGRGMVLSVLRHNTRARRLYQSLGFEAVAGGDGDSHERMRWPGGTAPAS